MSCGRDKHSGFTLLEVVIATVVIALVTLSIYRFVELNLTAIRLSTAQSGSDLAVDGLMATLQAQLNDLPPDKLGVLSGQAHKFSDVPRDEMAWVCTAGSGLLTKNAVGDYRVTLLLKKMERSEKLELGLRRLRADSTDKEGDWVPLIPHITGLEVRYFDVRLNNWLEKWTDPKNRPSLVRVRIWRPTSPDPHEVVLTLPTSRLPA